MIRVFNLLFFRVCWFVWNFIKKFVFFLFELDQEINTQNTLNQEGTSLIINDN